MLCNLQHTATYLFIVSYNTEVVDMLGARRVEVDGDSQVVIGWVVRRLIFWLRGELN